MVSRRDLSDRYWRLLGVSAFTLAAFLLRLCKLGSLSLTGDESYDVLFASQSLQQILVDLRFVQPYPPLFHSGLHVWLNLVGSSEFAVRYWAVACTVMLVPAVFALGLRLFDDRVAYLGALFVVVNPLVQWWGRDAHFYGYVVLWVTLLNLAALKLWQTGIPTLSNVAFRRNRLRYVLVALGSLLTYYFSALSWGALNLVALAKTVTCRWPRRLAVNWWGAQVVVILLYLPWLIWGAHILTTFDLPGIEQPPPWEAIWQVLIAFNLGQATFSTKGGPDAGVLWQTGLLTAILFVGLARSWLRRRFRQSISFGLTVLVAPLTLIYLISFNRPMFDPKYTVVFVPVFLLLLATAIIELARCRRLIGLLAVSVAVTIMLISSVRVVGDLRIAKSPDWRSCFEFVHRHARLGDVVVYNFPEAAVLHYNDAQLPAVLIPSVAKLENWAVDAEIESVVAGHDRVWFVPINRSWWDSDGETLKWLDRHGDRVAQSFFRGVHVNLYLTPSAWRSAMTEQLIYLSNGVDLLGFRVVAGQSIPQDKPISSISQLSAMPGDTLNLSLYWHSNGPTEVPFTVFTHLVGPDGLVYGQWDNPPVGGTYPTTKWRPGEQIVDQYAIPVAENAPPGVYRIIVGMYDPASGERVRWEPVFEDDSEVPDSIELKKDIVIP